MAGEAATGTVQSAREACRAGPAADELERANDNVRLTLVEEDAGIRLEARNLRPVASELSMTALDAAAGPSRAIIVPPLSTTSVFALGNITREVARERLRAAWRFSSTMGDPERIAPVPDHLYRLPFRAGRWYRLSQGFSGARSHQSEASRFALDFQLEVGEPVHAARAGIVVRAVDWFCRSGGPELIDQANLLVVLHEDGTMAHYVHLDHAGALVSEGDRVERGQHIGYAGMTGYTGGPHLHFVVRRERDIAIPVAFEGYADSDLSRLGRFKVP